MKRVDKPIDGVVYKTTNLINGKWYIGKNENNNPEYLGSGVLLTRAIKKYGKENFIKEILDYTDTRFKLNELEIQYIEQHDAMRDQNSYNIAKGGAGGYNGYEYWSQEKKNAYKQKVQTNWNMLSEEEKHHRSIQMSLRNKGKPKSAEHKKKIQENSRLRNSSPEWQNEQRKKMLKFYSTEKGNDTRKILSEKCGRSGIENGFYGRKHTQETKDKVSKKKTGVPNEKNSILTIEEQIEISNQYPSKTINEISLERSLPDYLIRRYIKKHNVNFIPSVTPIIRSQEEKLLLATLYHSGTTTKELQEKFGICPGVLQRYHREFYGNKIKHRIALTIQEKLQIQQLVKDGIHKRDIAKKFEIAEATVYSIIKQDVK